MEAGRQIAGVLIRELIATGGGIVMQMRERYHIELSDKVPSDTVSFDVTPAAQWFLRDDDKGYFDFSEVGPILAPYPNTWMEFDFPRLFRTDKGMRNAPSEWYGNGCLIQTLELPDEIARSTPGNHVRFLTTLMNETLDRNAESDIAVDSDLAAKWLTRWTVMTNWRGGLRPIAFGMMTVGSDGRYIKHCEVGFTVSALMAWHGMEATEADAHIDSLPDGMERLMFEQLCSMKAPFFFCLALLNCRNVNVIDKPPAPAPILKQRAKKGIPFIQYKMLDVLPLRTVNKQKGEPKPSEPKAMHFVRGHFKDFSDKGLFGKFKGVYWWSNQVRGSASSGIVDKDYRVRNTLYR